MKFYKTNPIFFYFYCILIFSHNLDGRFINIQITNINKRFWITLAPHSLIITQIIYNLTQVRFCGITNKIYIIRAFAKINILQSVVGILKIGFNILFSYINSMRPSVSKCPFKISAVHFKLFQIFEFTIARRAGATLYFSFSIFSSYNCWFLILSATTHSNKAIQLRWKIIIIIKFNKQNFMLK